MRFRKPALVYTITVFVSTLTILLVLSLNTEAKKGAPSIAIVDQDWKADIHQYVAEKGMNAEIAILINLGIHSGLPRLLVWDLKADTLLHAALVSHGCGPDGAWNSDLSKDSPVFSNTPDSHASSLGRYRIGSRGYSNWGINIKYLLHGLDATNSNGLKRVIVLYGVGCCARAGNISTRYSGGMGMPGGQ